MGAIVAKRERQRKRRPLNYGAPESHQSSKYSLDIRTAVTATYTDGSLTPHSQVRDLEYEVYSKAESDYEDGRTQATIIRPKEQIREEVREEILAETDVQDVNSNFEYLQSMGVSVSISSAKESLPSSSKASILSGVEMTVPYKIIIPKEKEELVQNVIYQVFEEINKTVNTWNPDSEVSKFNETKAFQSVEMSQTFKNVIKLAEKGYHMTDGYFNPICGEITKTWRKALFQRTLPDTEEMNSVKKYCEEPQNFTWNDLIEISDDTIQKKKNNIELDLGGVAKGYTVDVIIDQLTANGLVDAYVDWGSDIRTIGQHPDGRQWKCSISEPPWIEKLYEKFIRNEAVESLDSLKSVDVSSAAIATSGDYHQIFQLGYFHIMNPKTGDPLKASGSTVASVTVICNSCALADIYATAAMCHERIAKAETWLASRPDILETWLYSRNAGLAGFKRRAPRQISMPSAEPSDKTLSTFLHPVAVITWKSRTQKNHFEYFYSGFAALCSMNPPSMQIIMNPNDSIQEPHTGDSMVINYLPEQLSTVTKQIQHREENVDFSIQYDEGVPYITGAYGYIRCMLIRILSLNDRSKMLITTVAKSNLIDSVARPLSSTPMRNELYAPVPPVEDLTTTGVVHDNDLKGFFRCTASTVGIITTFTTSKEPFGITVTSAAIASVTPLILSLNFKKGNLFAREIASAGTQLFALNLMNEEKMAEHFSARLNSKAHQFADVSYHIHPSYNTPILLNGTASIWILQKHRQIQEGDHFILIASCVDCWCGENPDKTTLLRYRREWTPAERLS
eukprot:gb/GECH01005790.1/.p1 GENE.gb/GECH01005790.1/~~gb/GECH01005790.1/.p1  ORF type:complete len:793 (+),score=127.78 gb/GECH01005790.1/:1-2379(+)